MSSTKLRSYALLAGGSLLLLASPAIAQNTAAPAAAPAASGDANMLDAIVVTARKRSETLTETPVAVTALTAEDLSQRGIVDYSGLNDFAPGFRYETQGSSVATRGFNTFVVRGIYPGSDSPERQAVSVFVDGMPVGGGGAIPGLTDVTQVEVVKGPQSAYFGRSTFAGAVNFITRAPGFDPRFSADVTLGNYAGREVKVAVEGPIVDNILAGRISARHYHAGGQHDNYGHEGKLGERETNSYAGSLLFTPSDDLRIRANYTGWEDEDGPAAQAYLLAEDYNCSANGGAALNYFCGAIKRAPKERISQYTDAPGAVFGGLAERNQVYEADFLNSPGLHRKAHQGSIALEYDLPKGYSLNANYGFGRNKWGHMVDTANRPTGYAWFIIPYDIKNQSAEIRVSSDQNLPFKFLFGGNWFSQKTLTGSFSNKSQDAVNVPVGLFNRGQVLTRTTTDTLGLFGSLGYDFTDALSFSVEGRLQWDEISQQALSPLGNKLSGTTRSFTPRAILQYKIDRDLNLYASYSEGTRPAQFNAGLLGLSASARAQIDAQVDVPLKVDEERLRMGEFGVKGNFLDGRLQLLSAFYYGKWQDKQIQVGIGYFDPNYRTIQLLLPQGEVEVYGVEVEAKFAVTPELRLESTLAYNETEIERSSCSECANITGERNPVGNRLPRYPALTGTFSVDYQKELKNDWVGYGRTDFVYTGKQYATEANKAWTPDRSVVNARIGIQNDTYRFEIWGKNIFDNKTPVNIGRAGDTFTGANALIVGPAERATYGVRVALTY